VHDNADRTFMRNMGRIRREKNKICQISKKLNWRTDQDLAYIDHTAKYFLIFFHSISPDVSRWKLRRNIGTISIKHLILSYFMAWILSMEY
jgi:hypothetical protein